MKSFQVVDPELINIGQRNDSAHRSISWYLSGQIEESEGIRRFDLVSNPFKVGRRSGLHLSIPGGSVSKEHAELFQVNDQLWVRDLESTNGTFVNGVRISVETRLTEGDLIQFASLVFRVGRDQQITDFHTKQEDACDRALVMMQFERLINEGGIVPYFQPIVTMQEQKTIGYEVLGRSRLFGLKTPSEMFSAASRLNLEVELSQLMRHIGVVQAVQLSEGTNIFVNTHPLELTRDGLCESLRSLRHHCPETPITLEIHEAAITSPAQIVELRAVLNELDMKLAFDDFGVGRARLDELSEVRPDYVKFDMRLTRDIHKATAKRQEVVSLIVKMVNELGIVSLAEGIENIESHEILTQMNFKLGQGFFYGRPQPIEFYVNQ
ncbi:MAG TPA: EAL domain-containing protein [Pirellulaceae bacterium]|nr:EAL domain-containing protein [Pirellulaceae bacterium]HMO93589.1 EAL domain-containing protein [Pirellulaceae bacterium]HMP70513.1 EAL domain-containing protein [Pirellulaceae bacterium]